MIDTTRELVETPLKRVILRRRAKAPRIEILMEVTELKLFTWNLLNQRLPPPLHHSGAKEYNDKANNTGAHKQSRGQETQKVLITIPVC